MHLLGLLERERYLSSLKKELQGRKIKKVEMVLCPPFVHLEAFRKAVSKKIKIGAQNMFWERSGSYTGEISPAMLKNLGAEYVILGHSERRRYFCEKDDEISLKLLSALKYGLKPILCVGEDKEERGGTAASIVKKLDKCLEHINRVKIENIIICYEPVWAISSNTPDHLPTSDEIMSGRLLVKKFLVGKYGAKTAAKVKIIYGGSVSALNAKEVCLEAGMDGVLVGKESLVPHEFVKIAEIISN